MFNVANGAYGTKGDWVFMRGVIRLRGTGALVDYRGTVKAVAVGPTDVAWTTWGTEYGAPAEIFR